MYVLQFIGYTQKKKKLCIYIGFGIQLWIELMIFWKKFTKFRPKNYDFKLYTI